MPNDLDLDLGGNIGCRDKLFTRVFSTVFMILTGAVGPCKAWPVQPGGRDWDGDNGGPLRFQGCEQIKIKIRIKRRKA